MIASEERPRINKGKSTTGVVTYDRETSSKRTFSMQLTQLEHERPISIADACKYLGDVTGKRPAVTTVWRWCLKGCRGVRLESVCIGGRRYVTIPAIERFINRSNQPAEPPSPPVETLSKTEAAYRAMRKAQIDAAIKRLDEMLAPKRRKPAPR